MTARTLRLRPSQFLTAVLLSGAMLAVTTAHAQAACFTSKLQRPVLQPRLPALVPQSGLQAFAGAAAQSQAPAQPSNQHSVVGMWLAEFRTTGGQLWDQGFELFHADGTEVAVDNAVPPLLGNVCVGVWKSVAPRTIKLRHMTWNWNPDSTLAGTFLLLVTLTVGPDGSAYDGTFVSDSFDLQGTVIPAFHAEGTVRGTRITVD